MLLAGTQKAFALPPGTAIFVCSPAALAKAATMKDRGYYFDFVEFQKNAEQSMTPSTPSIGHVFALAIQAARTSLPKGWKPRYARHRKTNQMTRDWAAKHGFTLFPEKGFESRHAHLRQQRRASPAAAWWTCRSCRSWSRTRAS